MLNNNLLEKELFIYKLRRQRRVKRHAVLRRKKILFISFIFSIGIIILSSFFITYNIYISHNSKDLGFSVEYNFTNGFASEFKLLRVQKMSLLYNDGETAIVEASGLCKSSPHKNITVKGSFKKDINKSWYLQKIIN